MKLRSLFAVVVLALGVLGVLGMDGGAAAQPFDKPPAPKANNGSDNRANKAAERAAIPAVPRLDPLEDSDETSPPRPQISREARIEQRRQGNRVSEIVVTPAGRGYSYTIQNREGQRPASQQELSSGLSTPRFLKLEF